jgi:hypothetical protein
MNKNSLAKELASHADELIKSSGHATHNLARRFRLFLTEASDLTTSSVQNCNQSTKPDLYKGYLTDHGTAISPASAMSCIDDSIRTQQFIHGAKLGISARISQASRPQHLLYAGTGPFAPLILANLHRFNPTNLRVHFMDINPISVDYLRGLVENLGYSEFVEDYSVADASTVNLDYKPDILLTETMSQALLEEPQYWIVKNLKPQLQEGALIIPEEVRVDLMQNLSSEFSEYEARRIGNLIRLAYDSDLEICKNFIVPKSTDPIIVRGYSLETNVRVYDGIVIRPDESDITATYQLKFNGCLETIRLQYCPGEYGAAINYAVGFGD